MRDKDLQMRNNRDAHPYKPFNAAHIAGHGYTSLLSLSDVRKNSTQISS
jgi:hypothetical protein